MPAGETAKAKLMPSPDSKLPRCPTTQFRGQIRGTAVKVTTRRPRMKAKTPKTLIRTSLPAPDTTAILTCHHLQTYTGKCCNADQRRRTPRTNSSASCGPHLSPTPKTAARLLLGSGIWTIAYSRTHPSPLRNTQGYTSGKNDPPPPIPLSRLKAVSSI